MRIYVQLNVAIVRLRKHGEWTDSNNKRFHCFLWCTNYTQRVNMIDVKISRRFAYFICRLRLNGEIVVGAEMRDKRSTVQRKNAMLWLSNKFIYTFLYNRIAFRLNKIERKKEKKERHERNERNCSPKVHGEGGSLYWTKSMNGQFNRIIYDFFTFVSSTHVLQTRFSNFLFQN